MNRRHFLQTSGISLAAILIHDAGFAFAGSPQSHLLNFPDAVTAMVDGATVSLLGKGQQT